MPHVVNGVGTWYSGKRNIVTRRAHCGMCGHFGDLRSYDTTLFFVVIFVPIIPLRRLHVMDDCRACRKHRVIKQGEWDKLKDERLQTALREIEGKPGDRETTIRSLGTAVGLQDEGAFLGLTAILEDRGETDPEVLAALAEGYDYFGHHAPAEAALRRSLEIRPDESTRRQLGVHALMHGSVDEGVELLGDAVAVPEEKNAGILVLAVEAYRAAGRHAEALTLLERMESAMPRLAKDVWFKRVRKSSRKLQRSGKAVKSAMVHAATPARRRERAWRSRVPWIVGPALALIAVLWYLVAAWWIGGHRKIEVVNGLARPYAAEIGGVRVEVPACGRRTMRVAEGSLSVKIVQPPSRAPVRTVRIESDFWERPFSNEVVVVNPDATALVLWEQTEYVPSNVAPAGANTQRTHAGSPMYKFRDVDYVFEEFPATLQFSTNAASHMKKKSRVFMAQGMTSAERLAEIYGQMGKDVALGLAKNGVLADPDDEAFSNVLMALCPPAEGLTILAPLLDDKPTRIGVHRAYQVFLQKTRPQSEIAAEYRARLAKTPSDATLKYLLGRVSPDAEERDRVLGQAISDPIAGRFAAGAMAWSEMGMANFEEVLRIIDRVPRNPTNDEHLNRYRLDARHALGRLTDILAEPAMNKSVSDMSLSEFQERVYFTCRKDGAVAAEGLIAEYFQPHKQVAEQAAIATAFEERFKGLVKYVCGDDRPLAAAGRVNEKAELQACIAAGLFDKIDDAIDDVQDQASGEAHLMVALAAEIAGKSDVAEKQIAAAAAKMAKGDDGHRKLGDWLAGRSRPTVEAATRLDIDHQEKRIALAVLGRRFPEIRDECYGLARKLNFDRRPPYLMLSRAIGNETTERKP